MNRDIWQKYVIKGLIKGRNRLGQYVMYKESESKFPMPLSKYYWLFLQILLLFPNVECCDVTNVSPVQAGVSGRGAEADPSGFHYTSHNRVPGPGSRVQSWPWVRCAVELVTNLRRNFTIAEEAPTRAHSCPGWKHLLLLSHLRHY